MSTDCKKTAYEAELGFLTDAMLEVARHRLAAIIAAHPTESLNEQFRFYETVSDRELTIEINLRDVSRILAL